MSGGLLERLGFYFSKPKLKKRKNITLDEKLKKAKETRVEQQREHSKQLVDEYYQLIPKDVFMEIISNYDYHCVFWGSRKFARLVNACRNILDIEIITPNTGLTESDRELGMKILYLSCLLHVSTIKRIFKSPDIREELTPFFKHICLSLKLDDDAINTILALVFNGAEDESSRLSPVFHDALRIEEIYFSKQAFPKELMKTTLGANEVYRVFAFKLSSENVTPSWMIALQEKYETDLFVDKEKAIQANILFEESQY